MKSIAFIGLLGLVLACNSSKKNTITEMEAENTDTSAMINSNAKATFGGGCFWCIETIFAQLKGVDTVLSGYAGGTVKNPSYKRSMHWNYRACRSDPNTL